MWNGGSGERRKEAETAEMIPHLNSATNLLGRSTTTKGEMKEF